MRRNRDLYRKEQELLRIAARRETERLSKVGEVEELAVLLDVAAGATVDPELAATAKLSSKLHAAESKESKDAKDAKNAKDAKDATDKQAQDDRDEIEARARGAVLDPDQDVEAGDRAELAKEGTVTATCECFISFGIELVSGHDER